MSTSSKHLFSEVKDFVHFYSFIETEITCLFIIKSVDDSYNNLNEMKPIIRNVNAFIVPNYVMKVLA